MADNKISMPGSFGGLMRYDEEYKSRFIITPVQVIGFVIGIIVFVLALKLLWPVTVAA
jgi:preprotein translocase subunit Sec61beta